jgi:hypothetical protein
MSDGELNDLELEINRYLDGEYSDDEFERFLADRSEGIDIERFRSFKSRVERIEELYRQIDEPTVPDGYWEGFADRVAERLPDTATVTVWDKILNGVLPWRWPVTAYSYAGAIASVLLIFFIGKTVEESRKGIFAPKPLESVSKKAYFDTAHTEATEYEDRSTVSDRSSGAVETESTDKDGIVPSSNVSVGTERRRQIVADVALPKQANKIVQPISDGESGAVEQEIHGKKQPTETEDKAGSVAVSGIVDEAAPTVEIIEPDEESKITGTAEATDDVSLTLLEPQHIEPVAQDLPALAKMGDIKQADRLSSKSALANGYTISTSVEGTVWKYDNWNLDDLREELKLYETILTDSSYSSTIFQEFAGMKSSVAILTRDSVDIYDAVNTIDTLLAHNPEIDRRLWLQRRSNLRSLVPIRTNP